jgi:membrane-associated phospholipid phosphatase
MDRRRSRILGGAAALLAAFAVLTVLVVRRVGGLLSVDAAAHDALASYGARHPGWLATLHVITHFGDTATVAAIDAAVVAVCLLARRRAVAATVAAVAVGGWALRIGLREVIARPRPSQPFWPAESYSYPSGHETNTALMVGLALFAFWPWLPRWGRATLAGAGTLYALAVGFSRIAGGVHWLSDVVGGFLLAAGIVVLAAATVPAARPATAG